jgi:hypothetical protein
MTLRLFLLQPTSIHTARINQSSFTYPLGEVDYDTGAAIGTAQDEMTVLFGTSAGDDDLGRSRVRDVTGIGASGTLKIGRSSQGTHDGEVDLEDDGFITIIDDYRVWAKIPFIDVDTSTSPATVTSYKDHDLTVGDKTGADTPPVANAGVGFAATIDSGTSLITASWDASTNSFAVADGETISSYLWDVDDGSITSGTTTTEAITVTFPAGFRWVTLTVTDSNSQTHTCHMPVYARNPASDTSISGFNIESHTITPEGQRLGIRIYESISAATYPDGTLVMVWEDEPASASDRSHMVFIGWHHTDPTDISALRTGVVQSTLLECLDVAGKLDTLPGFSQSIAGDDSPATWEEMASPNMDKYLHYLLHWHSTALNVADWTDSGTGSSFPFVVLGSDGESLWDQVQRRAKALVPDYVLTCNTLGQLGTTVDPQLQDTGDRTATVQVTLDEADWTEIGYSHQRPPRVHWLRGDAIKASSSTISALFAIAPGSSPGQGEIEQQSSEQLAQSQTDLNATEGHRYSRINAPEGMFNITLTAGDDQDIEPADLTWVRLNVSSDTAAQRGLTFTNARGLVQEMNIVYEHARTGLAKTIELLWERETDGDPASTYIQPEDQIPTPEYPPPPPPEYDPTPGETPGTGFGTAYAFLSNKLAQTSDLSVVSPVWTDITGGSGTTYHDFILDPWNPTTRGFALTSNGVFRITDLDSTPVWTQVLQSSDIPLDGNQSFTQFEYKIQGSINVEDYFVCFAILDIADALSGEEIKCCYTEDAGDTWSFSTLLKLTGFPDAGCRVGAGFDVVPHLVGGDINLYAGIYYNGSGPDEYRIYGSTNRGATWSYLKQLVYSAAPIGSLCLNTPYNNNEDGNTAWVSFRSSTTKNQIYRTTDGWSTYTRPSLPGSGTNNVETLIKRLGIEIFIGNENQVAIWNSQSLLFKSTDGATFTQTSYSGYVPGTHGHVSGAGGFPSESAQYYILTRNRYCFVSQDGGETWTDKTGNLQSIITSNESDPNFYRGVIVPNWTE